MIAAEIFDKLSDYLYNNMLLECFVMHSQWTQVAVVYHCSQCKNWGLQIFKHELYTKYRQAAV